MDKINFENLPSTNTPINADNLNQLQTNIENAINEKPNVIDNLESTIITDALSANQGRILNERISEIIESGSNSNGNYIKFADGTMICTKSVSGTANITGTYYGIYHTPDNDYFDLGNYAQEFIEVPMLSVQFTGGNSQWIGAMQNKGKLHIADLHILSLNSKSAGAYYDIIAIGKWK